MIFDIGWGVTIPAIGLRRKAKAKTSQGNAYPPLVGVDDPWGSRQAERKQGRAKVLRSKPRSCGNASDARSTYATAYSSFARKPLISNTEAKYDCAHVWCNIHAAHFLFMFLARLLAVPPSKQNFESAPLFFPAPEWRA